MSGITSTTTQCNEVIAQSATRRVLLKMINSTSGAEGTGLTVAVQISKNGGAFGNPSAGATNATQIGNGWYYVDLSTTDTNTLGALIVRGTSSGYNPGEMTFTVGAAPANVLEWLYQPATVTAATGLPVVAVQVFWDLANNVEIGVVALNALDPTTTVTIGSSVMPVGGQVDLVSAPNSTALAAIATHIFQDNTSSDFTVADSIGKCLYTGNHAPGTPGGLPVNNDTGNVPCDVQTWVGSQMLTTETGLPVVAANVARSSVLPSQAGLMTSQVKLDAGASAVNNTYVGCKIAPEIFSVGFGQSRTIVSYVGATQIATLDRPWVTPPTGGGNYVVYLDDAPTLSATLEVTALLDMAQVVPRSNTAETVGDSLHAARAQGFGKWVLTGTTLTLYESDGATVAHTFTLDSSTAPTQRA